MPLDLSQLRQLFQPKQYLLTAHASERSASRGITSDEIESTIATGEVIEDYPKDKYGPSCLLPGYSQHNRSLHIQVSYPPNVKVITVYEPSPLEWEADWKTRKEK